MTRLATLVALMAVLSLPAFAQDPPVPDATETPEQVTVATDAPPADGGVGEGAVEQAPVPAGDPVLLRFRYTPGETLTYRTKLDGVGSVHIMGQAHALNMSGQIDSVLTVEKVDEDGNFVIVTHVQTEGLQVTMEGETIPRPRQDLKMRTTMTPRGQILKAELLEQPVAQGQQSPWNSRIVQMMTGGLDMKRLLVDQKLAAFPEEPVRPGDQWQGTTRELEIEGRHRPLTISTRYDGNVNVEDRTCARLDSEVTVRSEALGEMAQMLAMQGTTTNRTRSWFDPEAGRLIASMEHTEVNMEVALPAELTGAASATPIFLEMFIDAQSTLVPTVGG